MNKYLPVILLFFIYLIIFITQYPVILNIWEYSFDDGTYSHAFFIPVISLYLYYLLFTSNQLVIRKTINYLAIFSLIIACALLLIFNIAQFSIGFRIAIIIVLISSISSIFETNLRVIFPTAFLIFLIPIWGLFTPYLQQLSTYVVTQIMALTYVPTFVEGNLITIPEGVFEIAGGCSGLRYLIVSLTISSLFIFLNIKKYTHGLTFLLIAIIGALLTNWIRIALLVIIGHITNMESDLMHNHNMFGWYLYIPYMVALFYYGQHLVDSNESTKETHVISTFDQKTFLPVIITFSLILLISTFSKDKIIETQNIKYTSHNCIAKGKDIVSPIIVNYSQICSYDANGINITSYEFDPHNDNSKPTFYLNNTIPQQYELLSVKHFNNWRFNIIRKGTHIFLTGYTMVSGEKYLASSKNYKKLRLINATKGISSAKLLWLSLQCKDSCQTEFLETQHSLSDFLI